MSSATIILKRQRISKFVKIGMLSSISIILMMFEIALPIFPNFLKLDISDIPAIVGTITIGPSAGIFVELIKNILHIFQTTTAGVGEIANFIIGISLIIPIGLFYKKNQTLKNFIIGSIIGTILMVIIACLLNYYILMPLYAKAFGTNIEAFVEMTRIVTPIVVNFKTLILFSIAPFNILKAIIVVPIAYIVCKVLKPVLNHIK